MKSDDYTYDIYFDENEDLDMLLSPESDDESIETLIEQNRRRFYREWNGYITEDRLKIIF